jgi:anti-sigma-K factor RskA
VLPINTPESEYRLLFRTRTLVGTEKEIKAMTTIQYSHSARWYRFALVSLGVALAVATALAVYFAVSRTTEVSPTITRVTVAPSSAAPNCSRPLVPC